MIFFQTDNAPTDLPLMRFMSGRKNITFHNSSKERVTLKEYLIYSRKVTKMSFKLTKLKRIRFVFTMNKGCSIYYKKENM